MTTQKKILISAGHSGEFDGFVQTAGKRSPEIGPPTGGYIEGVQNRLIASALCQRLQHEGVSAVLLNPGPMSVPESAQTKYVRECVAHFGAANVMLLAIHNNADGNGQRWTDANGATFFVRSGDSQSAIIGGKISGAWVGATGLFPRGMKQKNFNILMVPCKAVLLECSFMTNKSDVEIINNQRHKGIAAIADVLKGWAMG